MEYSSVSVGNTLAGGSTTVVYKVPTGYAAKWNLMYLHNTTGSTKHITAKWHYFFLTSSNVFIEENVEAASGVKRISSPSSNIT